MKQPPGFIDSNHPTHVCKLQKSIYGLKQAPRQWFQKLTSHLQHFGFRFSRSDPSLLIFQQNSIQIFFLIYVDDILVTGNDQPMIQSRLHQLKSTFALKQLGPVSLFLGIQISKTDSDYFLHQTHYAEQLLQTAKLEECSSTPTPITPSKGTSENSKQLFSDPTLYRKLAGSLQYLTITRPDIAFATNRLCQHMHKPTEQHFKSLKRLLRYVKGTINYGLPLTRGNLQLTSYTDDDWASDSDDRKSISGFCTFLGDTLISWTVKKQPTVARSSTEAEYRALAAATTEVLWLRRLVEELHIPQNSPTKIYCDNTSAISLAKNPVFHARTKHIEIDHHFIRQHLNSGSITIHI
ncbi:putative mitochondrial protein [Dendrobium catenatum]|uniref:Putative mitochondrial protein n=1 Tax=Dendrobium catenatum TaxID=906689 RepID=A0A2I0WRL3_9ASPA|nr:putative mitochondrial protein [Dendrobium catenatum]